MKECFMNMMLPDSLTKKEYKIISYLVVSCLFYPNIDPNSSTSVDL